MIYFFKAVHDHLAKLLILVLQVLNHATDDLGPAHFVSDLDSGVHKLQKTDKEIQKDDTSSRTTACKRRMDRHTIQ